VMAAPSPFRYEARQRERRERLSALYQTKQCAEQAASLAARAAEVSSMFNSAMQAVRCTKDMGPRRGGRHGCRGDLPLARGPSVNLLIEAYRLHAVLKIRCRQCLQPPPKPTAPKPIAGEPPPPTTPSRADAGGASWGVATHLS
jgi:hypothetical protein